MDFRQLPQGYYRVLFTAFGVWGGKPTDLSVGCRTELSCCEGDQPERQRSEPPEVCLKPALQG